MDNSQKKLVSILANTALFAGVAAVVFLVLNYSVVKKENLVFKCVASDISEISITMGPEKLLLSEEDGNWYVDSEPISQKHVDILRNLYCRIPYLDKFDIEDNDLSLYGISAESPKVAFKTKSANIEFLIGGATPSGTEFYLVSPAEERVYTASNKIKWPLTPSLLDMGYRNVFRLKGARNIEITNGEGAYPLQFTKQNDKWTEDGEKIAGLMKVVYFENYFGPMASEDTQQYGFFLPDHIIKISDNDGKTDEYQMVFFNGRHYVMIKKNGRSDSYYVLILNSKSGQELSYRLKEIIKNVDLRGRG